MDYMTDYSRWCERVCEDYLKAELAEIKGDDNAIKERFAAALTFGTAGLRGVLGAGPNRMNVYTVGQATQGLAEWVLANGGGSVAISYDSRRRSAEFARETAAVLAANGVKAYIYDRLMPTPMLSFAVRELHCAAGVMVTASHNPAQYNGYKAYGPDGCQMTEHDADAVYANIQASDIFDGVKRGSFDKSLADGSISYIEQSVIEKYYDCVKSQSVRPGICAKSEIKIVYSPLNGTGNEPVRRVLDDIGVKNISIVKEQELPDGDFPTCPYPNPETREALALGLELAKKEQADVFFATDPDADRIGVAFRRRDGEYQIMSGNEIGALLLKYICAARAENGTMPKDPVAVMSIVSTDLAGDVAAEYGVELRKVLTGFKYIGETILHLEQNGEQSRFIFGFEESCGYLTGGYVRDKDAVVASLMVCEMTAWLKSRGMTAPELLEELFAAHGYYKNKVVSHEFAGLDGKAKMASVMDELHACPPSEISGLEVVAISDYKTHRAVDLKNGGESVINLPATDAIAYTLAGGATVVVRPSGTEPKMKVYLTAKEPTAEGSQSMIAQLEGGVKQLLGL